MVIRADILEIRGFSIRQQLNANFQVESRLRGRPAPLTVTHIHIKGCSIIEICIIYESRQPLQCVQPTCDWETHNTRPSLSLPIRCQLYSSSPQKRRHVFIHLTQATFTHHIMMQRQTHTQEKESELHTAYASAGYWPTPDSKLQAAFEGKSRVVVKDVGGVCSTSQITQ